MSYMDVMYGGLGQVNNNLQANLAQNAAMNQNMQASMAAQQQAAAAQQAQLAALYGPQGFGGQTAQYAGAGAAYGRGTGYYGDTSGLPPGQAALPNGQNGIPGGYPSGTVTQGPDLPNLSLPSSPFVGGGESNLNAWAGTQWDQGGNNGAPSAMYSGNYFNATGDVGQSPGMAPGYGGFNNPAVPTSPQQWYANGGYNPYDPNTYAGTAGMPGGMPQMLGTGSGGYDPQWGGSSIYSKGAQAVPSDWNNWFGQFQGTTGGGPNDYTHGGGWEREYLIGNPDVLTAAKASGADPIAFADQHFRDYGQQEGRSVFDAAEYLRENPDVFAAGANPFQHYEQYGKGEGRFAPMSGAFDPATYLAANPDVAAAGVDPTAHWLQYGKNEGRQGGGISDATDFSSQRRAGGNLRDASGGFLPQTEPDYTVNSQLATQRADYGNRVLNDPAELLRMVARLDSEEQNDPGTRIAIAEAMMNRGQALTKDPLAAGYYPKDQTAYNAALARVQNDPALFNQIKQEFQTAVGGTNLSGYSTDWASGQTARDALPYQTPTWTSPTSEAFFRKDFPTYANPKLDTGAGDAANIMKWYNSLHGAPPL